MRMPVIRFRRSVIVMIAVSACLFPIGISNAIAFTPIISIDHFQQPSFQCYDNDTDGINHWYGQSFVAVHSNFYGVKLYIGDPDRLNDSSVGPLNGPATLLLFDVSNPEQPIELAQSEVVHDGDVVYGPHDFFLNSPVSTVVGSKYFFVVQTALGQFYGIGMRTLVGSTYDGGAEGSIDPYTHGFGEHPQLRDFSFIVYSSVSSTPTANAGPDQIVTEGATVQLDGSNSYPVDEIISYQWYQLSGPAVVLSDPAIPNPEFPSPDVGPQGASLVFELEVKNRNGMSSRATCTITVTWENQPPTADAGQPQTVAAGQSVQLDASGSYDIDNGISLYKWEQIGGPTVQLSDFASISPTFTAPVVSSAGATLTFRLTVSDSDGLVGMASTIVNVTWVNQPPIANAGPNQIVWSGDLVSLNGSDSNDPDDGICSYQWAQVSGSPVTLTSSNAVECTFTAPSVPKEGQSLVFQLTVTDSNGLKSISICTITVQWIDTPPSVNAGNNVFILSKDQNDAVIVGTATDQDGDILTYTWSKDDMLLTTGTVDLYGRATLQLGDIPLSLGAHVVTLSVNDGYVAVSSNVLLTIENSSPTVAPIGEGTYELGAPVTLTAQVSDYDGDALSYTWYDGNIVLGSGSVQALSGGLPVELTSVIITDLTLGTHALLLEVNDGINDSVGRTIVVNMIDTTAPTISPVADRTILWPPNLKMVPVTIQANAVDNFRQPVSLAVSVACNEQGSGFWTAPVVDQVTGTIYLNLQSARAGNNKDGRQYTITIKATDQVGNQNTANVKVLVPHDQGK